MLAVHSQPPPSMQTSDGENMFRQAWHSLEEALHLREPTPPPVPPKDERWLVRTVSLATPNDSGSEPDASLWDRIVLRIQSIHSRNAEDQETQDKEEAVSISVPVDAAMSQLGIPDNEATDRQDQRNYFRRMALRCKERFEEDGAGVSDMDSKALPSLPTEQGDGARDEQHHWDRLHFHHLRRLFRRTESVQEEEMEGALVAARFVPREDPKEMKAAHRAFYKRRHGARSRWSIRKEGDGEDSNSDSEEDDDDEEDKKLFGSWWGCHSRRTDEERFLDKQIEQEWEKIHMPRDKDEKRKSLQEQNGSVSLEVTLRNGNGSKMSLASQKWWKTLQGDAASISSSTSQQDRKAITKKHQALAAAAAYEAMKEYQARQIRQGKKVSHGEMKAILAGMAMAEAVKLLEMHLAHQDKRKAGSGSESDGEDDGDDDNDQRDETVAEAGSKVLRLFELMRS